MGAQRTLRAYSFFSVGALPVDGLAGGFAAGAGAVVGAGVDCGAVGVADAGVVGGAGGADGVFDGGALAGVGVVVGATIGCAGDGVAGADVACDAPAGGCATVVAAGVVVGSGGFAARALRSSRTRYSVERNTSISGSGLLIR